MTGPRIAGLRLLLLVLVALGVAQMHTLGHHSADHAGPAADPAAGHPLGAAHASVPEPVSDPGRPERTMDPLTVCLAMLTALGLAAAVLVLLARRQPASGGGAADGPDTRTRSGRGPPLPVPPLARRLALQSVLRI